MSKAQILLLGLLSFAGGWWLRGKLHSLIMAMAVRILSSSIGQQKIKEMLGDGVSKLAQAEREKRK